MIKDIQYLYDPYRDQLWICWTDLSMSCCYIKPMPTKNIDMVDFVDSILSGEQSW